MQLVSSAAYKLDPFLPSGSQFSQKYDRTSWMTTFTNLDNVHFQIENQQQGRNYTSSPKMAPFLQLQYFSSHWMTTLILMRYNFLTMVSKLLITTLMQKFQTQLQILFLTMIGSKIIAMPLCSLMIKWNSHNIVCYVMKRMIGNFIQVEINPKSWLYNLVKNYLKK